MGAFQQFWEHNENEGESWRFWLQYEGNEDALARLQALVEDSENYYLTDTFASEGEVDTLVRYSDSGYMENENKVVGRLVLSDGFEENDLYKGGVADFFERVDA